MIGSGKVQTETRAVSGFQAVALRGAMNLVLRQGQREGVEIRADDNLLPLIETRLVDQSGLRTLAIDSKRGTSYSTRSEMTVTVDLIRLKALTISGSGDAFGDALKTDALKLVLSGSGSLKLRQFSAEALDIKVSGSGDVQVAGRAPRVDVVIAGSGDASVQARRALSVSIAGSGGVSHAGDATVKSSISGSGSVKRR